MEHMEQGLKQKNWLRRTCWQLPLLGLGAHDFAMDLKAVCIARTLTMRGRVGKLAMARSGLRDAWGAARYVRHPHKSGAPEQPVTEPP